MRQSTPTLRQLAMLYGVQTSYLNTSGQRCQAPPESLLAVLGLMGAPVASCADVPTAYRARRQALWQRGLEPVVVASAQAGRFHLRLPAPHATARLTCHLTLETGETLLWKEPSGRLVRPPCDVEGVPFVVLQLAIPRALPTGYHRLCVETPAQTFETLVIAAPQHHDASPPTMPAETWGAFLPLYALHTERSWGCGDFSDLETLTQWLATNGAGVVATLPLLAAFLDEPYEPSPYLPASRLFWNELYIDVARAARKHAASAVAGRLSRAAGPGLWEACRASDRVDYRQVRRLKRSVLARLAEDFFAHMAANHADFQAYVRAHPTLEHYARFRAVGERQRAAWPHWPEALRQGNITPGDYDASAWRYHMYVQWVAHEQLTHLARTSRDAGVSLYLDLPLGVHPHSYDVWRERGAFVVEVAAGAPPDTFYTKGQNWGFPPLHPECIRQQGYAHILAYLRQQLRHTGLLRIDHVMGLHRLFWVPRGAEASQGVYVRYAARELYAILMIEAQRHQVRLVGENLGTVPAYIDTALARHRWHRLHVIQYALTPDAKAALPEVCDDVVASLNTHDMPPFAAFCRGLDIVDRMQQGLLDTHSAGREQRQRQASLKALCRFLGRRGYTVDGAADIRALLEACLAYLSASPAAVVLVNLEDLWLETQPQNFPGTRDERPNWQAKARYPLEQITQMPEVLTALNKIRQHRLQRRVES